MPAQRPIAALLFVAGVLALAGWFVVYVPHRDAQTPVSEAEQRQIEGQLQSNSDALTAALDERLSKEALGDETERQNSDLGQALSLRCLQWTDLLDSRSNDETERYQEYACRRYNHYVTTGDLLPDPDDVE